MTRNQTYATQLRRALAAAGFVLLGAAAPLTDAAAITINDGTCPNGTYQCDGADIADICTATVSTVIQCETTANGDTTDADVTAVWNASPARYEVYGQDSDGNNFCCHIDPDNGDDAVRLNLIGGSYKDTLVFHDGAAQMANWHGTTAFTAEIAGRDEDDLVEGGNTTSGYYTERLHGDDGTDEVSGLAGNDFLTGDLGVDILNGDDGNDTVLGGGGNDTVCGGNGYDTLQGDGDEDILWGTAGASTTNEGDGEDGGTGTDTCDSHTSPAGTSCASFTSSAPAECH